MNATISPSSTIFFEMVDLKLKSGESLGGAARRPESTWVYEVTGPNPELKLKIGTCKGKSLKIPITAEPLPALLLCSSNNIAFLSKEGQISKLKVNVTLNTYSIGGSGLIIENGDCTNCPVLMGPAEGTWEITQKDPNRPVSIKYHNGGTDCSGGPVTIPGTESNPAYDCSGFAAELLSSSSSEIKIKATFKINDGMNATISPSSTIFFEMVDLKLEDGESLGGQARRPESTWVYKVTGANPELKFKIGTCKGKSFTF